MCYFSTKKPRKLIMYFNFFTLKIVVYFFTVLLIEMLATFNFVEYLRIKELDFDENMDIKFYF